MSNVALCPKGRDEITHFLVDAWRDGNKFISSQGQSVTIKPSVFDILWTDDPAEPVLNEEGDRIGWNKKPSELVLVSGGTEIANVTGQDYLEALKRREVISNMTYAQVEDYINQNVTDLASAKTMLATLGKVLLAVIKLIDRKK